jgi:hypothetical protein
VASAAEPVFRDWHSIEPYFSVTEPGAVWGAQPTYFIAEVMFLFLAAWGIAHSLRCSGGALAFSACLLGGAAVELLTILHGEVGNFYHSQSVLMSLGKREPLYMLLGCYGWIAYATMATAARFGGEGGGEGGSSSSALAQAAYAALLGSEAWALLDMMGAQFIWWTWHTSEPLYADRELGIPIASSFWMASSMGGIALALALSRRYLGWTNAAWGAFLGPLGALGFMHGPFTAIYHPLVTFAGCHASVAMWALRAVCAAPLLPRLRLNALPGALADGALLAQWCCYLLIMVGTGLAFDPAAEVRHSFSQACSSGGAGGAAQCAAEEGAFWGGFGPDYVRKVHVCPATNEPAKDLFRICDARCGGEEGGPEPLTWYKSCGTPKMEGWDHAFLAHAAAVLFLALLPFAAPKGAAAQKGKKE